VIAIIGVLVALLLPAVQAAREAARRMQCTNHLKQMGLALHNYHSALKTFPPGSLVVNQLSWRVFILPYLEQQNLHDKFSFAAGAFNGGANLEGPNKSVHALTKVPGYQCPSATREFASDPSSTLLSPTRQTYNAHYYGVAGPVGVNPVTGAAYPVDSTPGTFGGFAEGGILYRDSNVSIAAVRDGTSKTLIIGEMAVQNFGDTWTPAWSGGGDGGNWVRGHCCGYSADPAGTAGSKNVSEGVNVLPININNAPFSSSHPGGALFNRADGSVDFVAESIDLPIYKAMCSRAGGEQETYQP